MLPSTSSAQSVPDQLSAYGFCFKLILLPLALELIPFLLTLMSIMPGIDANFTFGFKVNPFPAGIDADATCKSNLSATVECHTALAEGKSKVR